MKRPNPQNLITLCAIFAVLFTSNDALAHTAVCRYTWQTPQPTVKCYEWTDPNICCGDFIMEDNAATTTTCADDCNCCVEPNGTGLPGPITYMHPSREAGKELNGLASSRLEDQKFDDWHLTTTTSSADTILVDPPFIRNDSAFIIDENKQEVHIGYPFRENMAKAENWLERRGNALSSSTEINKIYIKPIPASAFIDVCAVDNSEVSDIHIYNTYGQLVKIERAANYSSSIKIEIPVQSLKEGIYYLKGRCGNAVFTRKFLVLRP